ncbi:hypothetical protein Tco_0761478, partial [Tanacetum coccineum]
KTNVNDSWGWKHILEIRDKIKDHVAYRIGNGRLISMWYDNWSSIGPLVNHVSHKKLYDARFKEDMKVNEIVSDGKWNWPREWMKEFPAITGLLDPLTTD